MTDEQHLSLLNDQLEVAFERQDVALMARLHAQRDKLFDTMRRRVEG